MAPYCVSLDLLVRRTLPGYNSFSRSLSACDSSFASVGGDPTDNKDDIFPVGGVIESGIVCVGGDPYRPGMLTGTSGGLDGVFVIPSS